MSNQLPEPYQGKPLTTDPVVVKVPDAEMKELIAKQQRAHRDQRKCRESSERAEPDLAAAQCCLGHSCRHDHRHDVAEYEENSADHASPERSTASSMVPGDHSRSDVEQEV